MGTILKHMPQVGATSFTQHLGSNHTEASVALGVDPSTLTGSPEDIAGLPDVLRLPLVDAFMEGLALVFLIAIPFAALGILILSREDELPLRETSGLEELAGEG